MTEAPTDSAIYSLRPLLKRDEPFIFNSWLKSYRDSVSVRCVPNSIYFQEHHDVIEAILVAPSARVLVACNPTDSEQIYGYGVASRDGAAAALHWLYVKHPFRGAGIGRALENTLTSGATKIFYTHFVKGIDRFIKDRPYIFNPYLLKGLNR